jgi:outer membrane lipoprotein carrier protein
LLLAATGAAWCQEPGPASGEAALDDFLAEIQTLTADFRQDIWTDDQRLLQTTTGRLALQRPNRFLWQSTEPGALTVVSDGETLHVYDVELEQVTVAPVEDSAGASPAMLLSGDASVREQFEVVRSFEADGLAWVELVPSTEGSDFTSVRIGFKAAVPEELELIDGLNQITRVDLSNVSVNVDLPADTFRFEPPPGVEVLGSG